MKAFNWGLTYSFIGLVHCHHGREHGDSQLVLGKELRGLHPYLHAEEKKVGWGGEGRQGERGIGKETGSG